MEEKKIAKINLSVVLLILTIIVMGIFIYKLINDKVKLQAEVDNLSGIASELQEKINKVPGISAQTNSFNVSTTNDFDKNNVAYSISIRDESYATVTATKDEKTISKEFEMSAAIANTGTMELPTVGTVALVADTGGEYYGVHIYQLVNDEIKLLGTINCGADMVKEANYTVETKNKTTAVIKAKRNNESIVKEFEMSATIANANVIDIFNLGKVVLITEADEEHHEIKAYRLSQNYVTGETEEIRNVGSIQY